MWKEKVIASVAVAANGTMLVGVLWTVFSETVLPARPEGTMAADAAVWGFALFSLNLWLATRCYLAALGERDQ